MSADKEETTVLMEQPAPPGGPVQRQSRFGALVALVAAVALAGATLAALQLFGGRAPLTRSEGQQTVGLEASEWFTYGAGKMPCGGEGADLVGLLTLDLAACKAECAKTPKCNGLSHNKVNDWCALKMAPPDICSDTPCPFPKYGDDKWDRPTAWEWWHSGCSDVAPAFGTVSALSAGTHDQGNDTLHPSRSETPGAASASAKDGGDDDDSSELVGGSAGSGDDETICPASGENCTAARCCAEPGYQCFQKNENWSSCQINCEEGKILEGDPEPVPWSCKKLGGRTPDANTTKATGANATKEDATTDFEQNAEYDYGAPRGVNCKKYKWCAGASDSCYLKDAQSGGCMMSCDKTGETAGWSCVKLY